MARFTLDKSINFHPATDELVVRNLSIDLEGGTVSWNATYGDGAPGTGRFFQRKLSQTMLDALDAEIMAEMGAQCAVTVTKMPEPPPAPVPEPVVVAEPPMPADLPKV